MTFVSEDRIFYGEEGSLYKHIIPMVYRDKDKFWFSPSMDEWQRFDGPSYMRRTENRIKWFMERNKNKTDFTDRVVRWCTERLVDIEDLSETEILLMWSELL